MDSLFLSTSFFFPSSKLMGEKCCKLVDCWDLIFVSHGGFMQPLFHKQWGSPKSYSRFQLACRIKL